MSLRTRRRRLLACTWTLREKITRQTRERTVAKSASLHVLECSLRPLDRTLRSKSRDSGAIASHRRTERTADIVDIRAPREHS